MGVLIGADRDPPSEHICCQFQYVVPFLVGPGSVLKPTQVPET